MRDNPRWMRLLPGRIRIVVAGLQGDERFARRLARQAEGMPGIVRCRACALTGRALIEFDERKAGAERIIALVERIERERRTNRETAAAAEEGSSVVSLAGGAAAWVPLPLAVAAGGLALLGAKQLVVGRSAMAEQALPFYLSGLVSVATGYPLLRRGLDSMARGQTGKVDLLLGIAALGLAFVRENVVVLGGLALLQYVNWRRSRCGMDETTPVRLSPDIERYSERAGRLGLLAGAAVWAITRSPLRGIAVLLAANPRPAVIPAQYAWRLAQADFREREGAAPPPGVDVTAQLAQTRTLLAEDASLLLAEPALAADDGEEGLIVVSNEPDDDKAVCYAASLLRNSGHPWEHDVWSHAATLCRTIRTAYHVVGDGEGLHGKISDVPVCAGSYRYMQEKGVDCESYRLQARRLERRGWETMFVALPGRGTEACVGFIARRGGSVALRPIAGLKPLLAEGWSAIALHNRHNYREERLKQIGIDTGWLGREPGEVAEAVAALWQQGEPMLLLAGKEAGPLRGMLEEAGMPAVGRDGLASLLRASAAARRTETDVRRHLRITRVWNVAGAALAACGKLGAPLANLMADTLSLLFMARVSNRNRAPAIRAGGAAGAEAEAAAAAEPAAPYERGAQTAAAANEPLWHVMREEDAARLYGVDARRGYTPEQAEDAARQYGANRLEGKRPTPWLVSYLAQFKEFTTLVLLGTTAFAFVGGGIVDGLAMGAILLANAAIATMQERKAEQVVDSLNRYQPPVCKVIRGGTEREMSATALVPGDIVRLEAGDRVPADIRLLDCSRLCVNESALTGESLPVDKSRSPVDPAAPLAERANMVYMGTDIFAGVGTGIVVATGMRTEMGRLVALLKRDDKETTPLQTKVTSISKTFVKGALAAAAIVFAAGLLRGIPVPQMISTSIALAASAIPEGLPVTITIALSAGILRMARKQTLVRKLSALETLGRTTIICTDKTGTLTKNEMTVTTVATASRLWEVTGSGYEPVGRLRETAGEVAAADSGVAAAAADIPRAAGDKELRRLAEIAALCNNSKLERLEDGRWIVKGDPTEGALLSLAAKAGFGDNERSGWCRSRLMPFDSRTGKMSVVCHEAANGEECFLFTKGSVEAVLRHCSEYQADGKRLPLTEEHKSRILQQNGRLAADALRVLAFAYRPVHGEAARLADADDIDENGLVYVGLAGMADPPKPESEEGIRQASALGVKPVMITGDHPITAVAIARRLGIYDGAGDVLSGHEIDRLTDEELLRRVADVSVFARVTPEQKLRIVKAFQQLGHIVAMTGDGVNDTPAVKQADVGIAMGARGADVTKEAADIVLQQDDFGTIVEGVKEGRTIIGNIRKALGCLLTGNLAEIIVTGAAVMVGLPIPLVPVQILLMNLLTDALPAMVLAVSPGSRTVTAKRTDIVDGALYRKVVVRGVLLGVGSLGLFAASLAAGAPLPVAQSAAFATLVVGQLIQTLSWRKEGSEGEAAEPAESGRPWTKDRFLIGALGVSAAALLATLYVPPLARFFHTAPLPAAHWLPILLLAGSVSLLSKPLLGLLAKRSLPSAAAPAVSAAIG